MAEQIILPKQGNSVESCIIVALEKKVGDAVAVGDVVCTVETDKSTMEVEATAAGTLLAWLVKPGDDVPVLNNLAWVGQAGESVPAGAGASTPVATTATAATGSAAAAATTPVATTAAAAVSPAAAPAATFAAGDTGVQGISPRARLRAGELGIDVQMVGAGSGPGGRVIERDVQAAAERVAAGLPLAGEHGVAPGVGTDAPGELLASRMVAAAAAPGAAAPSAAPAAAVLARARMAGAALTPAVSGEAKRTPLSSIRKVIAQRMRESLQTTAQLTMNASADARAMRALRERFKNAPAELGLGGISINDMVLYAVARTLPEFPALNAHFSGTEITAFAGVDLGFAVDTDRGLLVPTIAAADQLSLAQLSATAKVLATTAQAGKAGPKELAPATFTVTNLGVFGVQNFTPVINPPQVAILGVGSIELKAVETAAGVAHVPHIGLSLTVDHQAVDGAPGARFLQTLSKRIAAIDLILAL